MNLKPIAFGLLLAGASLQAQASILTQWNFNSIPPDNSFSTGTLTPSIGLGTATLIGGTTATFASGDASGGSSDPATGDDSGWNTTGYATQGTGNKSRGAQFAVDTTGWMNISIRYDLRHSNTSSRYEQVQYTTDGITFIDIALFDGNLGDAWFNGRSVDLSSISAVNNNNKFAFRVVSAFAPNTNTYLPSSAAHSYGTAGTWRFDMVTVHAAPIPEPETYALMLAGLGLLALRLRKLGARKNQLQG